MKNFRCFFGFHKWCKGHRRWIYNEVCFVNYVCLRCQGVKEINNMGLMAN